ncbi:MAG: DNA primase, partial [Rhodospirillaceae bacterium]
MNLTPEFLEELRSRIAVSEVVGRRVQLQKHGREHKGLCPFHNEKSPSFTVVDDKNFYHCFGCGAHGDVITFVMETEGLAFPEAVERLAAQAGLEVPKPTVEDRQRAEQAKTLGGVVEAACAWYQQNLASADGAAARAYLTQRGLRSKTIANFRIGYAPARRGALLSALRQQGFETQLLVDAGLLKQAENGDGLYDYFRDRVMFPITDRTGRVIAFGGRILGDGQPKYLNSPDNPLFHKGRVLYGLAQARDAARKANRIVVCEGYMDVIALYQAGIAEAVAPLGTALTEEQIQV